MLNQEQKILIRWSVVAKKQVLTSTPDPICSTGANQTKIRWNVMQGIMLRRRQRRDASYSSQRNPKKGIICWAQSWARSGKKGRGCSRQEQLQLHSPPFLSPFSFSWDVLTFYCSIIPLVLFRCVTTKTHSFFFFFHRSLLTLPCFCGVKSWKIG